MHPSEFQPQTHHPVQPPAATYTQTGGQNKSRTGLIAMGAGLLVVLLVSLLLYANQKSQLQSVKNSLKTTQAQLASQQSAQFQNVDTGEYQAVFLTNNDVYFGKITAMNPQYLKLTNIFYLQNSSNIQQGGAAGGATSLVKLGCEIHAPSDLMVIDLKNVNFWENLQAKGQVSQAIQKYYSGNAASQTCPS